MMEPQDYYKRHDIELSMTEEPWVGRRCCECRKCAIIGNVAVCVTGYADGADLWLANPEDDACEGFDESFDLYVDKELGHAPARSKK